ncbi:MAG TPA: dolichyl-phosphate beta-glucosyltransferase [Candidatus Kapabacteria bacterium]|nr:dolichyl-phosphate beta-glucosyltransferase [Candidatus Kapabacteria bacterium]
MDILDECDLTIVIPCYNEARRLPRTLARTITYLATKPGKHEIVVISDGSTDGTVEETEKAFRTLPDNVRGKWFGYTPNGGKGKAVRVGVSQATGNRILFMDADYAVPLEDLARGEALLDTGFDIAIGSRTAHDTKIIERQSFLRERVAKLFGFLQRNYLGLRLKDTQCGFKLFTQSAAHEIFAKVKLSSVIFDGEMLWLAKRMGYKVGEFPVEWTHDMDSRITYNLVRSLKVFRDMMSIPFLHLGLSKKKVAVNEEEQIGIELSSPST